MTIEPNDDSRSSLLHSLQRYAAKYRWYYMFGHVVDISLLILQSCQPCQWETLTEEVRSLFYETLQTMSYSLKVWLHKLEVSAKDMMNKDTTFASLKIAIDYEKHVLSEFAKQRNQSLNSPRFEGVSAGYIVFNIIKLACDIMPKFNHQQLPRIKKSLARYIQLVEKPGLSRYHLLHFACIDDAIIPTNLIKLLLAAGAGQLTQMHLTIEYILYTVLLTCQEVLKTRER